MGQRDRPVWVLPTPDIVRPSVTQPTDGCLSTREHRSTAKGKRSKYPTHLSQAPGDQERLSVFVLRSDLKRRGELIQLKPLTNEIVNGNLLGDQ